MVVFGGQNDNGSLSDIYILDMKTLVWTRGPSIATGRLGMACAMYDDGFLTWGGMFCSRKSCDRNDLLQETVDTFLTSACFFFIRLDRDIPCCLPQRHPFSI